jgi:hypothetical protein
VICVGSESSLSIISFDDEISLTGRREDESTALMAFIGSSLSLKRCE